MRKLAILTFQTLDGVMQSPTSIEEDPSNGFAAGGWAVQCWDGVMEQVGREAMSDPYDLLLGRKTYDLFAPHCMNAPSDDIVSQKLNAAVKYVVTSSPGNLAWNNSIPVGGDIAEEISLLKQQTGPLLQVHGSWRLIQELLRHDLVDEYRIWTFPVVVGSGKRLFGEGLTPKNLNLVKSDRCSNGATMAIFSRT